MKNSIITLALASFLALTGCVAPLPISQLNSQEANGRWVSGREYLTQTQNGVTVTLSYYKNRDNVLIFDALVDNLTASDVEVTPTQFQIKALSEDLEPIMGQFAVDPEEMILRYDKDASRQQAQLANDAVANTIFATTDLVATVAESTNPNISQAEADARFNNRMLLSQDRDINFDRGQAYLEDIKNTRLYWEDAPLRRSTVSNKEYVNGRVYFEREVKAKYYQIIYELPGIGQFVFDYEQKVIPVN